MPYRYLMASAAAFALLMSSPVFPQEPADAYPSKPVTIIVPFAANSSIDQIARLYAQSVIENTGKQFLVVNRPGAAGSIGTASVAKAPADGYTLLATTSAFVITPSVYPNLTYDHQKDFAPVTLMAKQVYLLVVNPTTPFRNVQQYIGYAKANPEKLDFATSGAGSSSHLPGALLHYMTKTKVTFIHYKAASQRLLDVMAGRIHATAATIPAATGFIKSGKLRALGVASAQRTPLWPEMPTIAEQGVPGYEYSGWNGLVAPAGTPPALIGKLYGMLSSAGRDPNVVKKTEASGTMLTNTAPEEFRQHLAAETVRWRTLIRDTGIKLEE